MIRWNRQFIKADAKDFLRYDYWKAFVACLVVSLIAGFSGEVIRFYRTGSFDYSIFPSSLIALIMLVFIIFVLTVNFALEVGKNRFFLDGFKGEVVIGKIFSTFNSDEYFSIVKTQFLKKLYEFLWTLLLIIPGIIKSYEYRFVPYILAEEPNLPSNEVISRSRDITYGHKMDMFVLDLSFIGWILLGAIFCGFGIFFVVPYIDATNARLYNVLSGKDDFDNNFHGTEESFFDIVIE